MNPYNQPTRVHPRPRRQKKLSRRQFVGLSLCGIGSAATAAICGGGGLLLYVLNRERAAEIESIRATVTAWQPLTPETTPDENSADRERPVIIPRGTWGALEPNHNAENESGFYSTDNPEGWQVYADIQAVYNTVVIHHSVVYASDDISSLLSIQDLHRNDRKWADVAYHYFVGKAGGIYEGRPLNVRGVHVQGANTGTVGVCLLGNFMEESPSETQLSATRNLVQWLGIELALTHLASHRAFNPETLCPGDNLIPYLSGFAESAGLVVGTEGYQPPADPPIINCQNARVAIVRYSLHVLDYSTIEL